MLDPGRVEHIVRPFLERAIAPVRIDRVQVSETADSDGADAIEILAVAPEIALNTVGDRARAAADIQRALEADGERRFAFVRFVEPAWLASEDDEDDES